MPLDARDGTILRRTLGAISLLYAGFDALFILMILPVPHGGSGLYDPRAFSAILAGHAVLMWIAGGALRDGHPRAMPATLLAAAGTVFLVILYALRAQWFAAGVDGAYVLLAGVVLYATRNLP